MARKSAPLPKLCERCEAFFPSIASTTCPQCFAPLTTLTEDQALKAAELQLERLKDPEYVERKADEDEKFKEQSFGACLGVFAVILLATIVSLTLIGLAARSGHRARQPVAAVQTNYTPGQDIRDLLPAVLGAEQRGDVSELAQPGTTVPILHSTYSGQIQIYALPIVGVTSESLNSFRLAVSLVCSQTNPPLISQEVHTREAYYAIIGANGGLVGDVSQRLVNTVDH